MKRRALRELCVLAALASVMACNAAEVPVFSAGSAGNAGTAGSAGSAGDMGSAGNAGSTGNAGSAGSVSVAGAVSGAAGTSGGESGGGGTYAGQGGDVSSAGGDAVCHGNADCPDTFFCQAQTCEHGAPGVCVVRVPICEDNTLKPVCGCDHVTYWNECYAGQFGATKMSEGICSTGARTCHGNNDCNMFGATCAHLLPPGVSCGASMDPGTCWVAPDCTVAIDTRHWQSCPPPGSGGGLGPCQSTCEAVKVGHPFIQADSTTCP